MAYGLNVAMPNDFVAVVDRLSWVLATHPDAKRRDGAEAVRHAEMAARLARKTQPQVFDTLAAAYAEAGRFPDAVAAAKKAASLADDDGQSDLAEQIRGRLQRYQAGRPFHLEP